MHVFIDLIVKIELHDGPRLATDSMSQAGLAH